MKNLGRYLILLSMFCIVSMSFISLARAANVTMIIDMITDNIPGSVYADIWGTITYPDGYPRPVTLRYLGQIYSNIPQGSRVFLYARSNGETFQYWIIYMLINNRIVSISWDENPITWTLNYNTRFVAVFD